MLRILHNATRLAGAWASFASVLPPIRVRNTKGTYPTLFSESESHQLLELLYHWYHGF